MKVLAQFVTLAGGLYLVDVYVGLIGVAMLVALLVLLEREATQ